MILVTAGVSLTAVGILCSFRYCKRRICKRQEGRPLQVPEVSSSSGFERLSAGVRRRSGDSWESVELFRKMD